MCRQLGCAADSPAKGRAWGRELLAEGKWGERMGEWGGASFRYKRGKCCSPTSFWAFAVSLSNFWPQGNSDRLSALH